MPIHHSPYICAGINEAEILLFILCMSSDDDMMLSALEFIELLHNREVSKEIATHAL